MIKKLNYILSKALDNEHDLKQKNLDNKDLFDLLNTNYSTAYNLYKDGIKFYRADIDRSVNYTEIKSGIRVSQGTTNVYNLLVSEILPSWQKAQNRNKSIIMATSNKITQNYVDNVKYVEYIIFPSNNTELTIAPVCDMWLAFANINYFDYEISLNLPEINTFIVQAIAAVLDFVNPEIIKDKLQPILCNQITIDMILKLFDNNNTSEVIKLLNKIDSIVMNFDDNEKKDCIYQFRIHPIASEIIMNINKNNSIINILDTILNFKAAKFKNSKLSKFNSKLYTKLNSANEFGYGVEMWTESPCLLIKEKALRRYFFDEYFLEEDNTDYKI